MDPTGPGVTAEMSGTSSDLDTLPHTLVGVLVVHVVSTGRDRERRRRNRLTQKGEEVDMQEEREKMRDRRTGRDWQKGRQADRGRRRQTYTDRQTDVKR